MSRSKMKKICIVVLGDIGRSPRMQYHGMSLFDEGYKVTIIGYKGSQPIQQLQLQKNNFKYLLPCPDLKKHFPLIVAYIIKVLWQIITLTWALITVGIPDYLLYQNPPAVPALGVCVLYSKLFRSKLIIDWHNYAYSIMALEAGPNNKLVKLSKEFEFYFGRKANFNLCVTKAMEENLKIEHNISAITFYDRPPAFFRAATICEKHNLFLKLGIEHDLFLKNCESGETVFTKINENSDIVLKDNRPALLISSTSWTKDEDFSILLSALEDYEKEKNTCDDLPYLICAITGKGPLKEFYLSIIKRRKWKNVQIITLWLEAQDYPVLLGSADLGVCLHKSSSGLDLPMKVVDMFGCGVPVCALNFNCLNELVKHEQNGYIFENEEELASQIKIWFKGFPKRHSAAKKFLKNLEEFQMQRWHENWKFNVETLF